MYYFCKFLLFSQTSKLLLDPVFSTLRSAAKIQFKFIPICLIAWVLILVNILYSEPRHGLSIWIKDVNRHVARPRYRLPMKALDWLSGPTFSKEGNFLRRPSWGFCGPTFSKGKMNYLWRHSWGFWGPTFQKKETESSDNRKQNRNKTIFGLIDSDIFPFFGECGSAKASRRPSRVVPFFPLWRMWVRRDPKGPP